MGEYVRVGEILLLAEEAFGCNFRQLPRKRIMFRGEKSSGETITVCSPQSKMHPQGFYWVDITQEQARVLNETDKALICFRLEGRKLLMVKWGELKQYLTPDCMRFNDNEQNHWKLNIYEDHIKISGNTKIMLAEVVHYTPSDSPVLF